MTLQDARAQTARRRHGGLGVDGKNGKGDGFGGSGLGGFGFGGSGSLQAKAVAGTVAGGKEQGATMTRLGRRPRWSMGGPPDPWPGRHPIAAAAAARRRELHEVAGGS